MSTYALEKAEEKNKSQDTEKNRLREGRSLSGDHKRGDKSEHGK